MRILFFIVSAAYGQEERRRLCRACIDSLPDYDTDLIINAVTVVPNNAVMLNEEFVHCSPDLIHECGPPAPISLFIIIDHSASMSVYDPQSTRYAAACALIDTLDHCLPDSEIGIAVFSNKLLFHAEDDPVLNKSRILKGRKTHISLLQG